MSPMKLWRATTEKADKVSVSVCQSVTSSGFGKSLESVCASSLKVTDNIPGWCQGLAETPQLQESWQPQREGARPQTEATDWPVPGFVPCSHMPHMSHYNVMHPREHPACQLALACPSLLDACPDGVDIGLPLRHACTNDTCRTMRLSRCRKQQTCSMIDMLTCSHDIQSA